MQLQKLALQIQIIKIVKININKLFREKICIKPINKGQYYIFYINKKNKINKKLYYELMDKNQD